MFKSRGSFSAERDSAPPRTFLTPRAAMAAPTNEGAAPPSPPACTVIAAVLQNRAREVGVALFDKRGGPSLDLEQHVEVGESHATTLCELQRARPGVILTLAGDRGGALGDALARFARAHDCALVELPRKQFGARPPHTAVRTVAPVASKQLCAARPSAHDPTPRPQTDDIVGADLVARCARRGSRLAPNPKDAYLAFAAAAAVLQFVEHGGVERATNDAENSLEPLVGRRRHRWEPFPLHEAARASPGTVVVTCCRNEHFIALDPAAARVLEIARPLGPTGEPVAEPKRSNPNRSSKPPINPRTDPVGAANARDSRARPHARRSLLGLLDTCATRGGSRLMKASLLQPLRDHATINARLDAVEELLRSGGLAHECRRRLTATAGGKDVEAVTSMFAEPRRRPSAPHSAPHSAPEGGAPAGKATQAEVRPIDANPGRVAARIRTLLDTRRALEEVPKLGDALKNTNAGLLREIGEVLRDPFFAGFLHRIDGVFEPDVVDGRSSFSAKTRQVFAVKSGVDAFLDIARRNFCEATEAAHELIRALRERTGLESPRLDYTATGMFQIKVTRSDFGRYSVNASHFDASLPTLHAIDTLGDDATRPRARDDDDAAGVRNDRVVRCTCDGLDVINRRCVESADEAMRRSAAAVESVAASVRANVAALGALSSALSLLDVLCAFAVRVMTSKGPYVRPVFGDRESPLAIEAGRHPVLEELPGVDFVANSAYLSPAFNLSVVTGPNGGGKSTYLRQVAVLVVLAHSGCFVPATFFSAPPVDAIFTRVGTSDSMETDASTFAVECRECARILSRATCHSLVLVDELGRSTDSEEGERFAWATAEALLERGCKTLFATHARRLGKLAQLYPNVRTSTMAVDLVGGRRRVAVDDPNRNGNGDDQNRRMECRYRLVDGACEAPHYGLRAAEALGGFPAEMMRDAWAIARRVETAAAAAAAAAAASDGGTAGGGFLPGHSRRDAAGDDATRIAVERAARTAKVAERARRLFEIEAGGGAEGAEGRGGREKREAVLASLRATAADVAGFGGGGACA